MWDAVASLVGREVADADSPILGRNPDEVVGALRTDNADAVEAMVDLRLRVGRFGDGFGADPDGLTRAKLVTDHPHGVDLGPLVERFPAGIRTASGRIELFPPELVTELARLEQWVASRPMPELVLVGRRHLRSCNTWMHNVEVLVKGRERCTLQVHPADAGRLGIVDGGTASIASQVGQVVAPVEVTDEVMAGVVSLPFGWGYDEPGIEMHTARTRPGVNSNALTDDAILDDLSGNAVLNAIPVMVSPA
jgi:anaerobic selenocysteine-containing dehydrogenase